MKKNLIDVRPYGEDLNQIQRHLNENTEQSETVITTSYQIGQVLKNSNNLRKFHFSSFLFNNINILIFILIAYLFVFLFVFIFSVINFNNQNKFKVLKSFLFNLIFSNYKPSFLSSKISLILLGLNIYMFILTTIFRNLIKTDKVVVNTDEFIDSIDKLDKTSKILTFQSYDFDLFNHSSKISIFKSFNKRIEEGKFLKLSWNNQIIKNLALKNDLSSLFFCMKNGQILLTLSIMAPLTKSDQFFYMKSKAYYESIQVILIRKNLDDYKKKFINRR